MKTEVPNAHCSGHLQRPHHPAPQVRKDLGLKTGDNVDFVEVEKGRFAIFHRTGSGADQELHIPNLNFAPIPEEADQAIQ
jgi:hypothetical protein